jgi:hypothetical protein
MTEEKAAPPPRGERPLALPMWNRVPDDGHRATAPESDSNRKASHRQVY